MAVSNSVYISEYGQLGTEYGQLGTEYGQLGTVWHCLGTVWYTVHAWDPVLVIPTQ